MKASLRPDARPAEFLSDHGIRSLSRYHLEHPVRARPRRRRRAPSTTSRPNRGRGLFGGNSNWRGPVWFPINYLLIEALQKFDHYYGDDFTVEYPTGSGRSGDARPRSPTTCPGRELCSIFLRDADGRRPVFGDRAVLQGDPAWRRPILFFEYFHGDTGAGLGASHQTGWTALVAKLLESTARRRAVET